MYTLEITFGSMQGGGGPMHQDTTGMYTVTAKLLIIMWNIHLHKYLLPEMYMHDNPSQKMYTLEITSGSMQGGGGPMHQDT